jgi:hypothetical protein
MTCSNDSTVKRPVSPTIMTGLALAAVLALGSYASSTYADDRHDRDNRGERHREYRGYYNAPPVVYGAPYYYAPPVVYGPGIGVNLPGVDINIR